MSLHIDIITDNKTMKKCNKCNIEKTLDLYPIRSDTGKYRNTCKKCESLRSVYKYNNDENRKKYVSDWHKNNKEYIKEYKKNNEERIKANRYITDKVLRTNPEYKIVKNGRDKINSALKSNSKDDTTIKLIGLNKSDYREYLECMFDDNMSWENYGNYWHVDHIIPVSLFDLTIKENQYKAFNFKNTRPLNAKENLLKGNRSISNLYDIVGIDLIVKKFSIKLKTR